MIPPGTLLGAVQVDVVGAATVGKVDPDGAQINLGKLVGWWNAPPTSGQATQRVNDHGAWLGPAYYGARIIELEARYDGFNPGDSMKRAQALLRVIPVESLVGLSVTDEEGTLSTAVRQQAEPVLVRAGNRVTVNLSLIAPDMRRYTAASTVSTGLPVSSGGLVLPTTLPFVIGATSTDGTLSIMNTGDLDSYPVLTVVGPCAPFTITDTQGRQLSFAEAVPAGRSLIIDAAARTASLDGTAGRTVTGTWPRLVPGLNQITFQAASYDAGSRLSVTYRSARR